MSGLNRRTLFGVAASVAASSLLPGGPSPITLVSRPLVGPGSDWTRYIAEGQHVMRLDGTHDEKENGTRVSMTLLTKEQYDEETRVH